LSIRRLILAHLRRQFEVGAEESGTQLGDKLLHGIALLAKALAAEVAVESGFMPRQVRQFMGECRAITLGVLERLEREAAACVAAVRAVFFSEPMNQPGRSGPRSSPFGRAP
jgi:hypothetical protein